MADDVIRYRRILEAVAVERGILLVDIKEMSDRAEGPTTGFFEDAVHPNKAGDMLITEKLYEVVSACIDNKRTNQREPGHQK